MLLNIGVLHRALYASSDLSNDCNIFMGIKKSSVKLMKVEYRWGRYTSWNHQTRKSSITGTTSRDLVCLLRWRQDPKDKHTTRIDILYKNKGDRIAYNRYIGFFLASFVSNVFKRAVQNEVKQSDTCWLYQRKWRFRSEK